MATTRICTMGSTTNLALYLAFPVLPCRYLVIIPIFGCFIVGWGCMEKSLLYAQVMHNRHNKGSKYVPNNPCRLST